jgi:hypothetical protein
VDQGHDQDRGRRTIEDAAWLKEDVVAMIDERAEHNAPKLTDRLVG